MVYCSYGRSIRMSLCGPLLELACSRLALDHPKHYLCAQYVAHIYRYVIGKIAQWHMQGSRVRMAV